MDRSILRSERGIALVIALIMLLILTFMGISAINTATFEANIAGNERSGADAFYAAEAVSQIALRRLDSPDSAVRTGAIPRTKIGEDSWGWSETQRISFHTKGGYDSSWAFIRYQINATGTSYGATKEVEVQVSHGPFPAGTQY